MSHQLFLERGASSIQQSSTLARGFYCENSECFMPREQQASQTKRSDWPQLLRTRTPFLDQTSSARGGWWWGGSQRDRRLRFERPPQKWAQKVRRRRDESTSKHPHVKRAHKNNRGATFPQQFCQLTPPRRHVIYPPGRHKSQRPSESIVPHAGANADPPTPPSFPLTAI